MRVRVAVGRADHDDVGQRPAVGVDQLAVQRSRIGAVDALGRRAPATRAPGWCAAMWSAAALPAVTNSSSRTGSPSSAQVGGVVRRWLLRGVGADHHLRAPPRAARQEARRRPGSACRRPRRRGRCASGIRRRRRPSRGCSRAVQRRRSTWRRGSRVDRDRDVPPCATDDEVTPRADRRASPAAWPSVVPAWTVPRAAIMASTCSAGMTARSSSSSSRQRAAEAAPQILDGHVAAVVDAAAWPRLVAIAWSSRSWSTGPGQRARSRRGAGRRPRRRAACSARRPITLSVAWVTMYCANGRHHDRPAEVLADLDRLLDDLRRTGRAGRSRRAAGPGGGLHAARDGVAVVGLVVLVRRADGQALDLRLALQVGRRLGHRVEVHVDVVAAGPQVVRPAVGPAGASCRWPAAAGRSGSSSMPRSAASRTVSGDEAGGAVAVDLVETEPASGAPAAAGTSVRTRSGVSRPAGSLR